MPGGKPLAKPTVAAGVVKPAAVTLPVFNAKGACRSLPLALQERPRLLALPPWVLQSGAARVPCRTAQPNDAQTDAEPACPEAAAAAAADTAPPTVSDHPSLRPSPFPPDWTLAWSDEFNGNGLVSKNWDAQLGDGAKVRLQECP